jgi:uroporphyrinogen III methyltransferase/synthase
MSSSAQVMLVGAGPGDPGLITVKGRQALEQAEVVVYDYLANPLLLRLAPPTAELVYVGKKAAQHTLEQDDINRLLLTLARSGRRVVRLKGGDPYIFGRGSEEASFLLENGVAVDVVPGIPAALGAAAYAGIPLTDRRYASSVTFVTGHEDPTRENSTLDWHHLANTGGTLVLYMGVKRLGILTEQLTAQGLDAATPVAVVQWATYPHQRVVTGTLQTIADLVAEAGITPPALTIIGHSATLRPTLNWFERKPLFGKRIVVTRSRSQASVLLERLTELGAQPLEVPTIDIQPPLSWDPLDGAISQLQRYQWLVFTSVNGVTNFFERLFFCGLDARALAHLRIAAIGEPTAELLKTYGLRADLVPPAFTSVSLAQAFTNSETLAGKRMLLARADIAEKQLAQTLQDHGAVVDDVVTYRTVAATIDAPLIEHLLDGTINAVTFTSSSTARNFVAALGKDAAHTLFSTAHALSIGPQTSAALRELGIEPAVESSPHTIDALIATLLDFFKRGTP